MDPSTRPPEAPFLGVGIGLRPSHVDEILSRDDVGADWFEVLSENHMVRGGRPRRVLEAVRAAAPVALHGVSMNLGSVDELDSAYLRDLRALADRSDPAWVSDHLCWTGVGGRNLHDLMPLPFTEEALRHVAARIRRVQDALGRRMAVENVSSYLRFRADPALHEWEFLAAVAEEADCGVLLDVNNVAVSAHNHGFAARRYLDAVPAERVFQIHLAGYSEAGALRIDTHDAAVSEEVWELYAYALGRLGPVSTSIEWDDAIPPLAELEAEARRARAVLEDLWPGAKPAGEGDHARSHGGTGVAGRAPTTDLAARHGP